MTIHLVCAGMKTLICLIKHPSETFKAFNDRLAEACTVMRPSGARCAILGTQPKVDLIELDDDEPPVRVAVCPLDASSDAAAMKTQERLSRVFAAAEGKDIITADTEPPLLTICMWPLEEDVEDHGDGNTGEGSTYNNNLDNVRVGSEDNSEETGNIEIDDDIIGDEHNLSQETNSQDNGADVRNENTKSKDVENDEDDDDGNDLTISSSIPPTPPAPTASFLGRPPFGFRRRSGHLMEDPDEAEIVRTVLDAYDSGLTDDRIISKVIEFHGEWVREHWQPKETYRHVRRMIEREAFYHQHLKGLANKIGAAPQ